MIDDEQLDRLRAYVEQLETRLSEPGLAAKQAQFTRLVREHGRIKGILAMAETVRAVRDDFEEYRRVLADEDADPDLRELAAEEIPGLETDLEEKEREMRLALVPPDPDDDRSVIVEIRAGTGGDEAALFAGDLYRMYSRLADVRGWTISVIDASPAALGGYKEVVFSVEGEAIYRTLRYESGCHRVQRIPVTESSGRIHTSAATVAVLPEAEAIDAVDIKADELRIDTFCSSGPGGQHVNTTQSAVRITHLPTGLVAQCQDEKSQHRNKEKAMKVLTARLLDQMRADELERQGDDRRSLIGSGDRSERIRTYNFPQNRLTDHRINLTLYSLDRVMEGEMEGLLTALRMHDVENRLQKVVDFDRLIEL